MSTGRRPIETRKAGWARWLAARLAGLGVRPNLISLASVACAGLTFAGLLHGGRWGFLAAGIGIQLRLICNLLDGMVAVEGGLRSKSGEIFNELPDRFSDILSLMGAGLASGHPALAAAATILAIMTAYVRALASAAGAPADFSGPMAKQHRMAVLTTACGVAAVLPGLGRALLTLALVVITAGCSLTVARRTVRAIQALERRAD